jgi:hypothetical protein
MKRTLAVPLPPILFNKNNKTQTKNLAVYRLTAFTTMVTQYFYLVCIKYEQTWPQKIFMQESQAIRWGRVEATKSVDPVIGYSDYKFVLYRQPITRKGKLEYVKTLEPFAGADWDIDKTRTEE